MSPKKILALTAFVAVLFGFIFFIERKMPSTAERERKGDLYWDIPAERIERIQIVRGSETLEFQRADASSWRMIKPEKYPADSFAVSGAVSELAEFKRAPGGDAGEAKAADYGLEKPSLKATMVWSDPADPKEKKTRTVDFGIEIPGTDVAAARVEGSEKVLFVPSSVLSTLKKSADDFESREVFGAPSGEVKRVEILRGRGRLVLSRKDGVWWLVEPLSDLADGAEADRLVGQLTALRAKEFIHGTEDLAALGLNPPLYRVTLTGGKGAGVSADFGATRSDGNSVYARHEGVVLTVDRDITDELSKEAVAFRSSMLLGLNRSDVTGLEAGLPKRSFAFSQKEGGWSADGHAILAAAADDAINAVLDLKSKAFLDENDLRELSAPVGSVTVRMKSGPPWTISLHPRPGDIVARVSSRPGGYVLDRDTLEKLETAFQKAVAAPTPAPTKKS